MQAPVLTILIFTAILQGSIEAFSDAAMDCCLTTKDTRIPMQIIVSYFHQTTESGCSIPATIFITKKGKKLCAPTAERHEWIRKHISHLDRKKKNTSVGTQTESDHDDPVVAMTALSYQLRL